MYFESLLNKSQSNLENEAWEREAKHHLPTQSLRKEKKKR